MLFRKLRQRMAFNSFISGDYQRADTLFRKLLEDRPNAVGMRYNLGLVALARGGYEEAVHLFAEEIERFGDEYHRLRALGDAFYLWGRADAAAQRYRAALAEAPGSPDSAFLEARLAVCGDAEAFARAAEGGRCFDEGNVALKNERYEEARELFERAVALDPTNFTARNNLGSIYLNQLRDYTRAAEQFEAALRYTDLPLLRKNLQVCRREEERKENEDA